MAIYGVFEYAGSFLGPLAPLIADGVFLGSSPLQFLRHRYEVPRIDTPVLNGFLKIKQSHISNDEDSSYIFQTNIVNVTCNWPFFFSQHTLSRTLHSKYPALVSIDQTQHIALAEGSLGPTGTGDQQIFLLAIISYDRCLAICNPMRYHSFMKPHICVNMIVGSYLLAFFVSSELILVCQFQFCDGNNIDHFFCDFGPLIELSTSDISSLLIIDFSMCIFSILLPFLFILITYVLIIFTIMNISSASGRWKAFSTCSSHLVTVCSYYGTLITVYVVPSNENSINANKFKSLLYIVMTPMVNPIIYSLRNQEIKKTLQNFFRNIKAI
ncbi:olfactory receptor 5P81-like [Mantella aurantiaca]